MPMISMAAIEAGQYVILNVLEDDVRDNTRRLSRSATMDGGCVISDGGYSDGDRTMNFTASGMSREKCDAVWAFFESASMIGISCSEGYFLGYLESVSIDSGEVSLSILVREKVV